MAGQKTLDNLKIGDTVLLFYNASMRFATDSGTKSGFILADLSGSGSRQLLTVFPAKCEEPNLPNIQFATFKILASNKYEAQTRYQALLEKLKEVKRKKASKNALQLIQLQVTQAKRDCEVEQAENAVKQQRLKGSCIYYGDSVQLLHTLTDKYICVSSTETSITENTKLKVFLQKKDSIGCLFRLHPRIKVNTVGEEVNYDDQVKFESVAAEGQSLHCSKKTFGDVKVNINSECFELNLASKDSPLKIIRHHQSSSLGIHQSDNTLKASGVVRFFHRKHQCYIVGEGSFAGRYGTLPQIHDDAEDTIDGQMSVSTSSLLESTLKKSTTQRASASLDLSEPNDSLSSISPSHVLDTSLSFDFPRHEAFTKFPLKPRVECDDKVILEDVHFRKKRGNGVISSLPSTSPNTFWQIEKFNEPCSGEPMLWTESCRIRHLPTRRYLAVTGNVLNYKVTLRSCKLNSNATVFELFPVLQQVGEDIDYESYVRIKHRETGTWLHLNKDCPISSSSDKPNVGLQDSKELFQVIAIKNINSDDAFTLEKVGDNLTHDFNYVAGITAVLTNQLKQCESINGGKPHSPKECRMDHALSSLYFLQSLLHKPNEKHVLKNKQKLLRSLKTLDLVIRLLNLHRNERGNDQSVCTACFRIITSFLEGNSNKNKTYISRMIRHIFTPSVWETELSEGETVEKALIGIAQDNPSLLYEEEFVKGVSGDLVQKLLATDKDSDRVIQLLEGLSVLCSYKGVPIKQNQIVIMKQLQNGFDEVHDGQKMMFYPLRLLSVCDTSSPTPSDSQVHFQDHASSPVEIALDLEQPSSLKKQSDSNSNYYASVVQFQALTSGKSTKNLTLQRGHWYELSKGNRVVQNFLLAQLNLLIMMCRGDNKEVITTLQGDPGTQSIGVELDFDLIMSAVRDNKLTTSHPKLRALLLELLKVMYVEVGENRPFLEKFPFSFKIGEVSSKTAFELTTIQQDKVEFTALTGIENPYFPSICQWIKDFLHDDSECLFAADEDNKNEVVVKVLQLLAMLVKYGYYKHAGDVKDLLPSIFKLLDGKDDIPTETIKKRMGTRLYRNYSSRRETSSDSIQRLQVYYNYDQEEVALNPDLDVTTQERIVKVLAEFREGGGRYKYKEESHSHFMIKHWSMVVLNLFFNFQLYKNLQNFIYDFRWLTTKCESMVIFEENDIQIEEIDAPKRIKSELKQLMVNNPRDLKFLRSSPAQARRIFTVAKQHLKDISHRRNDPDLSNNKELPNILLDLANYEHNELIQHSLLLLDRCYSSESDIFERALESQLLLTTESIEFFNKMEVLVPKLIAYLQTGFDEGVKDDDSSPVRELTTYCWLEDEVEGFEPHQINQNIILSFGVVTDVVEYVIQYCRGAASGGSKKVIECLEFLRAMLCKNSAVLTKNHRLLQQVDLLLKVSCSDIGHYIGILLREMYSGGPSITLAVEEEKISRMMNLIFLKGRETSNSSALTDALLELLLVKELALPLKHNQLRVARTFSFIREDDHYWCQDLLAEGQRKSRWAILTAVDDHSFQLKNLLMITDLLATCAYGELQGVVESICCTIFSEDELIQIISSPKINIYRKRPFMKFLVWVYMNAQGDLTRQRANLYVKNRKLWNHVSEMARTLLYIAEAMKDMSHASYLSVKELLISPSWKYSHKCPYRKYTDAMPVINVDSTKIEISSDRKHTNAQPVINIELDISGVEPDRKHAGAPLLANTNSIKFNISDVLLYFSEGYLPFLQLFFGEFFKSSSYKTQPEDDKIIEDTYISLLAFHPVLNCKRVYFSTEVQVKLYHRTMLLIKPTVGSQLTEEFTAIESSIEATPDVFSQEVFSLAREKYHSKYSSEVELNMKFKTFVSNYKAAYEGINTKKEQLIEIANQEEILNISDTESYSEFLDDDMSKPGPRYLPLGQSFQEHVVIFKAQNENVPGTGESGNMIFDVFGSSKSVEVVKINPADRLLKQLEISLLKMRSVFAYDYDIGVERQVKLDIKCLQILRALVYNQTILCNAKDKETDSKKYRRQQDLSLEDQFQSLGITVSRVIPLLSHPNEKIVNEVLAFLEIILVFGDRHVQEGLKELINSREFQIFPTLQKMLRRTSLVYNESQLLVGVLKARIMLDKKIMNEAGLSCSSAANYEKMPYLDEGTSSIQADGTVLLVAPRNGSPLKRLFSRKETTQVVIVGGDNRVPFLALYQHPDANADIGKRALEMLQFYDLNRITLITKVLALMCDGQHRNIQNFLRDQTESFQSINMVSEVMSFLYQFSGKRFISYETLQITNQILQTLVEVCVGNYRNHEVIFDKNIMSVINYILQIDITGIRGSKRFGPQVNTTVITNFSDIDAISSEKQQSNFQISDYVELRKMGVTLKASAVELLEVMLEVISSQTKTLSQQIAGGLDIGALHSSMVDFFVLKSDKDLIRDKSDRIALRGLFKSYNSLMHLVDNGVRTLERLRPTEKNALRAWEFCEKKSRSVEVVYRDSTMDEGLLTRVHFNVNLNVEIKEELTDKIKYKVDRSTHGDKLRDFHKWMVAVKRDTCHYDSLARRNLHIFTLFSKERYWFLLLLTFLLNILNLIAFEVPDELFGDRENATTFIEIIRDVPSSFDVIIIYILGILHIILATLAVLEYFIVKWPHFVLPAVLYKFHLPKHFQNYWLTAWMTRIQVLPKFHWTYSSINIFGPNTLYLLIFLVSSAMSLVFRGYFYGICLLYVIIRNDILQRALKSVTKNWKSLFWVGLFLLVIIFNYAILGFTFFQNDFQDSDNNVFCETLEECFISILRFGLIDNFLDIDIRRETANAARYRFLYDVTFFILVAIIGLNIVFGVIVDTFSELRAEKFNAEQDMQSKCFICSIPSHEFEKLSNMGFEKHIKDDHNMWNYIYYSMYLDQIDTNNHNAIEKYVYDKISSGNIDYIPFNQALVLEGKEDEGEQLKKELQELRDAMKERFMNLSLRFDALENLVKSKSEQ